MLGSLQHTVFKTPVLLQRVKKKTLSGGLRSHSSQETLIWGCEPQALCACRPCAPPPLLPQRLLLQGSQGHLLLLRKRGYTQRCRRARSASQAAPRGTGREKEEVPPGSVLCRQGRATARCCPRGLRGFVASVARALLRRTRVPQSPGSFCARLSTHPGTEADCGCPSRTPPTRPS